MATRKTNPQKPNEADTLTFISNCIRVTAVIAKQFEDDGLCDPQLYESLKGLQMEFDKQLRKTTRRGMTASTDLNKASEAIEKLEDIEAYKNWKKQDQATLT